VILAASAIYKENGINREGMTMLTGTRLHPEHSTELDQVLMGMLKSEFPAQWAIALEVGQYHENVALSQLVRLTRRMVEVGAAEVERGLSESG
jgi:glutamate mutase epsilon subunit